MFADFTVGQEGHFAVSHFFGLHAFLGRFNQLEIPGACFVHPPVEIKGVAASSFVVARLHVFKFVGDRGRVITNEVVERNPKRSRFFSKEITFVLNSRHFLPYRKEIMR